MLRYDMFTTGGVKMYLTKKDLSELLQVSITWIDRHMQTDLPYVKIGNAVRFEKKAVLEWIEISQKGGK